MKRDAEYAVVYALRCAACSTLAYGLAYAVGLGQPIWAAISAVVVSQEKLGDTQASLASRVAGTALGAAISVAVGLAGGLVGGATLADMAISVGIAAAIAHFRPNLRVAMFTCPIVLMTAQASQPLLEVGFRRACEVSLGAVVGWAIHRIAETVQKKAGKPAE